MDEIKKGDRVVLKSGGPIMTVQTLGNYSSSVGHGAVCVWFDERKPMQKLFAIEVLDTCRDEE